MNFASVFIVLELLVLLALFPIIFTTYLDEVLATFFGIEFKKYEEFHGDDLIKLA